MEEIKNIDKIMLETIGESTILKQQTRFNNGLINIWNVHHYIGKYYLMIDKRKLFEITEEEFEKFKDMS